MISATKAGLAGPASTNLIALVLPSILRIHMPNQAISCHCMYTYSVRSMYVCTNFVVYVLVQVQIV